ncbi:hydrogenase maturation nickel metallochaperone HypA [Ginsengibacter hankyongi]|uniref:Hydrogenase maturation factor HypA n=1 Tax=Ginsengibacter hankyongi TaxID=2607284 RepID=A0A5J5IFC9_9BACT|nr:hydrogenase maturation nickel metallochaperone HypA [Ginsengibacter hankyongi]KAA9038582.1 hydrogenase maturation nickel metallochaperone HypA [Ginsengibacter hankyongi]
MHELSICQSILNTIENELDIKELENIREIHLKIGMLACIEPEILKNVFQFIKADTAFQNSELFIEMVDVSAECKNCGNTFKVEKYIFVCPLCGEPASNITEGKELLISKIISEEPSYAEVNE